MAWTWSSPPGPGRRMSPTPTCPAPTVTATAALMLLWTHMSGAEPQLRLFCFFVAKGIQRNTQIELIEIDYSKVINLQSPAQVQVQQHICLRETHTHRSIITYNVHPAIRLSRNTDTHRRQSAASKISLSERAFNQQAYSPNSAHIPKQCLYLASVF